MLHYVELSQCVKEMFCDIQTLVQGTQMDKGRNFMLCCVTPCCVSDVLHCIDKNHKIHSKISGGSRGALGAAAPRGIWRKKKKKREKKREKGGKGEERKGEKERRKKEVEG